jgi:hypothetical protein
MAGAYVLAERMAALLRSHEPGWRLPRLSTLARRFNVSLAEVDAAVSELCTRHLLRRLPDGQVFRASPADYLVSLENLPGLGTRIDPMNGEMVCERQSMSWRRVTEEISSVIGVDAGEQVCVLRYVWRANGDRAALATTYVPERLAWIIPAPLDPAAAVPPPSKGFEAGGQAGQAGPVQAEDGWTTVVPPDVLQRLAPPEPAQTARTRGNAGSRVQAGQDGQETLVGRPGALHIEMAPPPPSIGKSLRLGAGQSGVIVSVRYDDPSLGTPVALTVAVLRPDLFRIVITSAAVPSLDTDSDSLTDASIRLAGH